VRRVRDGPGHDGVEEMMRKLRCGDVVRMQSGGPFMTVASIVSYGDNSKDEVRTCWINSDGNPRSSVLAPAMLVLMNPT
jgi:uncharacterized protein YodC (DUF2158 family)